LRHAVLFAVILLIAAVSCGAVESVYPIDVVLSTTSDWTDVSFVGATLVVVSHEIVEGADAPGLRVAGLSTLSVGQSIDGRRRVTVRFRAVLADPAEWVQIQIEKGHLGETTVSIHERDGPVPLATWTHEGVVGNAPANVRAFSLRSSRITSAVSSLPLESASGSPFGEPKVLAFYYPWYGTPDGPSGDWVHWNPYRAHHDAAHDPAAGLYDSNDPETVRRHIREAKSAGIDGFIASWWGAYGFEDRAFEVLIDVAEQEEFKVTIYYEIADIPSEVVIDLSYFLSRYADSPALLHADGRPVVFFYVRVTHKFTLAQWENVFAQLEDRGRTVFAVADGLRADFLTVFDGIHMYNPVGLARDDAAAQYEAASLLARAQDRLFAATVLPGYDEAYKDPSLTYLDREDGQTYRAYWTLARASSPHWILITSYNEWHEGSEIEPSVEFGTAYLEITAEEAAAWRRGERTPPAEPDRDGDGVPDSDDYCPDFPGRPETNGC